MQANKQRIQQCFNKAARRYEQAADLQKETAHELFQLLPAEKLFNKVIDIGCGTGYCTRLLAHALAQIEILGIDIAPEMILTAQQKRLQREQYMCADFDNLPLAKSSIDLMFSNLALQWSLSLETTLSKLNSHLKKSGYLIFSTLLDGTLIELKQAWQQIDEQKHTNHFLSLAEIQACLANNNFQVLEVRTSTKKRYYQDVFAVLRSLKSIGANCVIDQTGKSTLQKQCFINLNKAYARHQELLPLTYELGYFVVSKQ